MSTDPAPTMALCKYVSMSVWMGVHTTSSAGIGVGAMAEHRVSLPSEPIIAASWGYQRRIVFDLVYENFLWNITVTN